MNRQERPDTYTIRLRDGRRRTYDRREALLKLGYYYNTYADCWEKTVEPDEVRPERKYARRCGFRFEALQDANARSSDYRRDFFDHNDPLWRGMYQCVYCGRLKSRDDITVDHVIPVHKAQTDAGTRRLMRLLGIDNVNDLDNLVPACARCNQKKGGDSSLYWVWRSRLGKHPWFWAVLYGGGAAAAVAVAVLVFTAL